MSAEALKLVKLPAAVSAASDADLVAALTDVPFELRKQLLSVATSCEEARLAALGELSAAVSAGSDADLVAALTDVPFELRKQLLSITIACEEASILTLDELSAAVTAASDTDLVAALTDVSFELRNQLLSVTMSCEEEAKAAASRSVVHVVGEMRNELQEYAAQQEDLRSQVEGLAESVFNFKEQVLQKEIHSLRVTMKELENKSSGLEVELVHSHQKAQQLVEENKELFEMIGSLRKQIIGTPETGEL
jgi:chromosome segregation ATPase